MSIYAKLPLSGSVNGRPILIKRTVSIGTLIHTSVSGTSSFDEIWLYAHNNSVSPTKLTVEFGSNLEQDNIELTIPGESGLVLVLPGLFLQNELLVNAFAAQADVISIHGYVHRVS